jgi:hypothetical protein
MRPYHIIVIVIRRTQATLPKRRNFPSSPHMWHGWALVAPARRQPNQLESAAGKGGGGKSGERGCAKVWSAIGAGVVARGRSRRGIHHNA